MKVDMLAIFDSSGDKDKFTESVKYVRNNAVIDGVALPIILMSDKNEVIEAGLEVIHEDKPLIHAATFENYTKMSALAKKYKCPLVVRASDIEKLSELSEKVKKEGVEEIVLDIAYDDIEYDSEKNSNKSKSLGDAISDLTKIRRLALKKKHKPLGYPTMVVMQNGKSYEEESLEASSFLMKYGSIVVLRHAELDAIFPMLVMRQNIFTDPQKPIQVKPGIYEIGRPNEDSPVLITTNFSLTYFCVASDIDNAKIPSYLLVIDTDGLSVLTAYAAGKWTAEQTAEFLQKSGIENKVKHRSIIIPGLVARMSGKLAEKSAWNVLVGPKESAALPAYIKNEWHKKKIEMKIPA
jgi:acetyl-CoA decarbonylase/synthase complex subunit gamma